MKQADIKMSPIDGGNAAVHCLMDQEIPGTRVTHYSLNGSEKLCFPASEAFISIWIVCAGQVSISAGADIAVVKERGVYAADPTKAVELSSPTGADVLELRRYISPKELKDVCAEAELPYAVDYDNAPTYTEDCKSAKTVSRMLIPARIVPRFAMGSVETRDEDLVAQHTHPMLEQYFYGLQDNSCELLIDNNAFPFAGNTLIHIPLGSNHGVRSADGQVIHYLWMDFLFDEEGLAYMDREHKIREEDAGRDPV